MTTTIDPTALLEALVRSLDPSAQRELASELWRSAETTAPIVLKAASSAKSPHGVVLAFADVRPAVHLSCKDAARLAVTLARDAGEGDPLAPLRPAGVLGRGALTEAVPERVVEMVLERVNADRREIARLRAARSPGCAPHWPNATPASRQPVKAAVSGSLTSRARSRTSGARSGLRSRSTPISRPTETPRPTSQRSTPRTSATRGPCWRPISDSCVGASRKVDPPPTSCRRWTCACARRG